MEVNPVRQYLKAKINELERNSKNKNISELYRGINRFKKGYQPRTNIVKEEKGDLVADSHSILTRWRKYFSQLLNVHVDNDVRQTKIQRAEPTVPDTCVFEVEMAIEKLKRYKSESIHQISAELIKAGSSTICSDIPKLINSIWNKEELPEQWKESVTVRIYKKGDKTDCSNYRGISLLSATNKILSNIILSKLTPYAEDIIGDRQRGFRRNRSITNHIFCIRQIFETKWEYSEAVHQLFVDFKKAYDSVSMVCCITLLNLAAP